MAPPILSITVMCGLSLLNTAAIRATPDSTFTVINTFEPGPTGLSLTNSSTPEIFRCTDLSAVYDSDCWEALGLTNWLSSWKRLGCNSSLGADKSNCCELDEEWSTCFMRVAIGGDNGYNYTKINNAFCKFNSQPLSPSLEDAIRPHVHYIVKNIFGKGSLKRPMLSKPSN